MDQKLRRRDFLKRSSQAGLAGCALLICGKAFSSSIPIMGDEVPDPRKLNYCGYTCPEKCDYLTATLNDDAKLKKECFKSWGIEERYGIKYDEKISFCYGCKTEDKPEGVVVSECTVRKCVQEKEIDCCIECKELRSCDKDLWKRFPDFYEGVKKMQLKYWEAEG